MADEMDLAATEANGFDNEPMPQVSILVQYAKDLSFENPNAPASLQATGQPKIEVNVAVNAKRAGDAAQVQEARSWRDDWNVKNPDTPIKVNMPGVIKRARAMKQDALNRTQKTTPVALKQTVRREIAERRAN